MKHLTPQEEQLMIVVWSTGKGSIKEYREKYPDPKPPYTSIATIIKKLECKGYLQSEQDRKTYIYTPLIKEEDYKKTFMKKIVNRFFSNSYKELVSFFAKDEKLSEKDLDEIISIIKKKNETEGE